MNTAWTWTSASKALVVTSVVGLLVACSGSSAPEVLQSSSSGTSGSGNGSSGTSGGTSGTSGGGCPPCEAPPVPGCTGTGPCGCGPYVCPPSAESGTDDCTWSPNGNPCGDGKYCASKTCGAGKCVPLGTSESTVRSPVCGCDGVSYWNESIAAKNGVSIAKTGSCGNSGKGCNSANNPCPAHAKCNYRLSDPDKCKNEVQQGTCWVTPSACPPSIGGPIRPCGALTCIDECSVIKLSKPWYPDQLCPK